MCFTTWMDLVAPDALDRRKAMVEVPALIKAYLRLGGFVGEGAFIDHAFNTTDVCLILDTARMNERQRRIYSGALAPVNDPLWNSDDAPDPIEIGRDLAGHAGDPARGSAWRCWFLAGCSFC